MGFEITQVWPNCKKLGANISFQLIEAIEIFYIIKSITVGSAGEAVKKTKVFFIKYRPY